MTSRCPFCTKDRPQDDSIQIEQGSVYFLRSPDPVLQCAGMIIPLRHVSTPFDLTQTEWNDTFELLGKAKLLLDQDSPDGYNIGWNVNPVAGQTVPHVHLHVIGRFVDEPFAQQGIRHHLKKQENIRSSHVRFGTDSRP
ncbi:HIT domain-containing protein [Martelella sp. HB161492]|uniref:HIT family protein n=1 Tax=Martelella sp. HB161492 TaxID=2720726 RepID=UPI0015903434|nr:HIT domain-containing protein [Martelella sp. HB161492]